MLTGYSRHFSAIVPCKHYDSFARYASPLVPAFGLNTIRSLAVLFLLVAASGARAQQPIDTLGSGNAIPLTLDEALREARNANAHLPVAARGVEIARAEVREARARRSPTAGLAGGLNAGGPLAYTTSQGAAQVVGAATLLDGGLRRANLRVANYRLQGTGAGFRIAEKDVDLAVRLQFSEMVRAESEIEFREQGITRLRNYLAEVRQRSAAGQPVGSDVLTTQVRLGTEEAALADASRKLDEARIGLNDVMGRVPDSPLEAAALPPPAPPTASPGSQWLIAPDVREAEANTAAARAGIAAIRSERRPQLQVSANLGILPVFGRDAGTGPNSGKGFGGAVLFSLGVPLFDGGVFRARLDRANLLAAQAHDSEIVVKRQVRFSSQLARSELNTLYKQVEIWGRNVPVARDAYLQTQSMYTGGAATALEVLDAYTSWINANESYADAIRLYRQAEANYIRWATP